MANIIPKICDELSNSMWSQKLLYLLPSLEKELTISDIIINSIKMTIWTFILILIFLGLDAITFMGVCFAFLGTVILSTWLKCCIIDIYQDEEISVMAGETQIDEDIPKYKAKRRELIMVVTHFHPSFADNVIDEKGDD